MGLKLSQTDYPTRGNTCLHSLIQCLMECACTGSNAQAIVISSELLGYEKFHTSSTVLKQLVEVIYHLITCTIMEIPDSWPCPDSNL